MNKKLSFLATFTFCIFLTGNVIAQEEAVSTIDSTASTKKFTRSINMCPGGIAFGVYSFNFEYLFNQTHGLVSRFDYESISESYSGDPVDVNGFALILNYRWHWSGAMESGFLGSYVRYRTYIGSGTSGSTKFDFTMPELTVGLNVGKRWVWNNGLNLTLAFGYGISTSTTDADPNTISIKSTINDFKDDYTFLGPFLGEFSIGYAF